MPLRCFGRILDMFKRMFKDKSKKFKSEYWLEARKCFMKHLPLSLLSPMCKEAHAFNHTHSVQDSFESRSTKSLGQSTLRICSYNIWRNYHPTEINKSLQNIFQNSDIVLIQEDAYRSGKGLSSQEFVKSWDHAYTRMYSPSIQTEYYNFEHSGQSTFSRYKINESKTYTLPLNHKPFYANDHLLIRTVLYTQIQHQSGQTIGIYNVHLSNLTRPAGRNREIKYLLKIIAKNKDSHVVIGGDFNTYMGPFETAIRTLKKAGYSNGVKRFWKPMDLDHIFVSDTIKSKKIIETGKGHLGSDHQPTDIVEIRF